MANIFTRISVNLRSAKLRFAEAAQLIADVGDADAKADIRRIQSSVDSIIANVDRQIAETSH